MKSIVHIPESCKEEFYTGFINALYEIQHIIDTFVYDNPDREKWSDVDQLMYNQLLQSHGALYIVVKQIEKIS